MKVNPLTLVLENAIARIPALQMAKHKAKPLRVLIANQNREYDHRRMLSGLKRWLVEDPHLELVILADRELASSLPQERIRFAQLLSYRSYRQVMGQCQLALLPLSRSMANSCKTPIKLMECAAESVATISGPELYGTQAVRGLSVLAESPEQVVEQARKLANDWQATKELVERAHHWVSSEMALQVQLPQRLWLYRMLWRKRREIDRLAKQRFACTSLALAGELML